MSRGSLFRSISRLCNSWLKIGARFAPNVPRAWKSFWAHLIVLLANGGQEEARFDPFGDSVNLIAR